MYDVMAVASDDDISSFITSHPNKTQSGIILKKKIFLIIISYC